MNPNNVFFKFEFMSAASRSPMKFYVVSNTLEDMHLFMSQHGFSNVDDKITMLPENEFIPSKDGCHLLSIHRFASNAKPGIFNVMTTEDFITRAIENISNDLADHSIFGEAILRNDIEFIKMICKLMDKLPHMFIADYALADESLMFDRMDEKNGKSALMELAEYRKRGEGPTEDNESQLYQQGLYDAAPDKDTNSIYPITIEGYISTFTELMIDCYC